MNLMLNGAVTLGTETVFRGLSFCLPAFLSYFENIVSVREEIFPASLRNFSGIWEN